ncbi:hypothetical protein L1887_02113 [Cichorium endivia]|nr:hypothetical protein L1887_02113 [Cichorium endivia]
MLLPTLLVHCRSLQSVVAAVYGGVRRCIKGMTEKGKATVDCCFQFALKNENCCCHRQRLLLYRRNAWLQTLVLYNTHLCTIEGIKSESVRFSNRLIQCVHRSKRLEENETEREELSEAVVYESI